MNEILIAILEIPFVVRVSIVMLIIWIIYALTSGLLMKIVILVPMLFNCLWLLVYKLVSSLIHILHRNFGKSLIEIDQAIVDFFGNVYGFVNKIKVVIENKGKVSRPFAGPAFLILATLTIWIALPTWLHIDKETNLFTVPYHKYIEIENKVIDMVYGNTN